MLIHLRKSLRVIHRNNLIGTKVVFFYFIYNLCMSALPVYLHSGRGYPILLYMVVSHHMGTGDWMLLTVEPSLYPPNYSFKFLRFEQVLSNIIMVLMFLLWDMVSGIQVNYLSGPPASSWVWESQACDIMPNSHNFKHRKLCQFSSFPLFLVLVFFFFLE